MIIPVIIAGGTGTRMWPESREHLPKQFFNFLNNDESKLSLFQQSIVRFEQECFSSPLIIANRKHETLVNKQVESLSNTDVTGIIYEPEQRNTLPAVVMACLHIEAQYDQPQFVLVSPSDHYLETNPLFLELVSSIEEKNIDKLIVFGFKALRPETGYGYISKGSEYYGDKLFEVEAFIEKPDKQRAEKFVDSNKFFWNSGMFFFRSDVFLNEVKVKQSAIYQSCIDAYEKKVEKGKNCYLPHEEYKKIQPLSVDTGVMEITQNALVAPLDGGWSDVGSWQAVWEISKKDEDGNVLNGDVISLNSENNLVVAETIPVAVSGVNNLIVVQTDDALLICDKDHTQSVKQIVNDFREKGFKKVVEMHTKVEKPWGSFQSMQIEGRYQVKRLEVKPGKRLSIQKHMHRTEHWIVVKGAARIIAGERDLTLFENESTYIKVGEVHRLENVGKINLIVIEVQTGSYLGEDDIIRIEDDYERGNEGL